MHRHWHAVSFCKRSTNATLCYMVLQPAAYRSWSIFRALTPGACYRGQGSKPLLQQLQWLPVQQLATGPTADHLQVGCADIQDAYLNRHITARDRGHILHSSTVSLLSVPFHRMNFSRRAFRCTAPTTWKSLPHSVITATHCQLLTLALRLACLIKLSVLHIPSRTAVPVLSATSASEVMTIWHFTN